MALRASISPGYLWRPAGMAVMFLLFACWSAYDGFVGYPEHNKAVAAFEKIKEDHPSDWKELWGPLAKEKGWSDNGADPGKPKARFDIITQYVYLGLALPIGAVFAISFLGSMGRWVECDENGLTASNGQKALYSAITNFNKERWRNKGIAVVTYTAEDNLSRKLVLDDWKFDRDATTAIVVEIEKHITPDKLTGPPEPPPGESVPSGTAGEAPSTTDAN
ncbi:MAG: hypothetical protein K8S99_15965 [Planctomycetes bacterium]|nr:hypothetical protein [Planctomycetota bacterium]